MAAGVGDGDGPLNHPRWLRLTPIVPAAFLVAFLVVPVTMILRHAIGRSALEAITDSSTWQIVLLAAAQALMSTAAALLLGIPLANVVTRYRYRGRALAQALLTVPFVLPTVIVALAFRQLFGGGTGLVLVVVAHAFVNLAVVVRIVGAHWAQIDPRAATVARTLGAGPLTAFRTITLPMLKPAIAASAAVVFAFCFTSLGIVLVLGDASTRTLEGQILRRTSLLLDFPGASALALVQLAVVATVLILGARARSNGQRLEPRPLLALPPGWLPRATILGTAILGAVVVLLPITALAQASFNGANGWTLAWWMGLDSIDAGTTRIGSPLAALGTSAWYALLTGVIASLVGGFAALSVLQARVGRAIALIALAPLGVSAATIGLGTLLAYGRAPADLRGTGLLVPLAHAMVAIPLVVAVAAPALRTADPRLTQVAATLGARPTRAFATAYGPILMVVMVAAAGLAAAVSLGEFGAASFLAREGSPTVPVQIVRLLGRPGEQSLGSASALAIVLTLATLALVLAVDSFGRRTSHMRLAARA